MAHAYLHTDLVYAASVQAANAMLRSLFGFTTQMSGKLGCQWARSIPAFLVLGCLFRFYKHGRQICAKCRLLRSCEGAGNDEK